MIDLEHHWTTEAIDTWVKENPPCTHAPEHSLNKMVSVFLSQSLPPPTLDALASCNFKLADFSHGMSNKLQNILVICNLSFSFSSVFI